MPPKPNFKHQRLERDRAKKASKEAKLQEKKEQLALRKAGGAAEPDPADNPIPGSEE